MPLAVPSLARRVSAFQRHGCGEPHFSWGSYYILESNFTSNKLDDIFNSHTNLVFISQLLPNREGRALSDYTSEEPSTTT